MNTNDDILETFKNGNDQHRLELFLQHRDIREDFDNIENEENTSSNTELATSMQIEYKTFGANEKQSLFIRMKRWCFSLLS